MENIITRNELVEKYKFDIEKYRNSPSYKKNLNDIIEKLKKMNSLGGDLKNVHKDFVVVPTLKEHSRCVPEKRKKLVKRWFGLKTTSVECVEWKWIDEVKDDYFSWNWADCTIKEYIDGKESEYEVGGILNAVVHDLAEAGYNPYVSLDGKLWFDSDKL